MRVLTANELQAVSGGGADDDLFEVLGEIFFYVCIEIIEQVIIELMVHGTINMCKGIHDYFYPPQTVVTSHFRPLETPLQVA